VQGKEGEERGSDV